MKTKIYTEELKSAIDVLEEQFGGADNLIRAAFAHSFFVAPDKVREKPVFFPEFVRASREHYPEKRKGDGAVWKPTGKKVRLDRGGNSKPQTAWERYTGRPIERGSGYGLRHIWGEPWNPDAFTAGWNFCYMPFWAGMLTEKQHPHEKLQTAFKQASWNLFFGDNPVCSPPDFVKNPEFDLDGILGEQPILILKAPEPRTAQRRRTERPICTVAAADAWEIIKQIRGANRSWKNIRKATLSLQEKEHEPFSTPNVAATSKSAVRRMQEETGLDYGEIEKMLDEKGVGKYPSAP